MTKQNPHGIKWNIATFTEWTNATFIFYPATGSPAYEVAGLGASVADLRYTYTPPVVVFITPKSRFTWAGSPFSFYVETDQNLLGVEFRPNTGFHFVPSLVPNSQELKGGVEELAKHVALNIDYDSILGHAMGVTYGKAGGTHMSGSTIVDLCPIFKKFLFFPLSANGLPHQQLSSFSIDNGVLRAEMIRDIFAVRQTGTVWIRIADRKLIRAVENGVQVYPEETKP